MNLVLVVFAISLCVRDVTEAFDGDASIVTASPLNDQKDIDTSSGPAVDSTVNHRSTASDDVNCTTIDDVTAARRSLCPALCRCSPLDGQDVWTNLTVDCSGQAGGRHRTITPGTQSNFTQDLVQLLSTCTSKLQQLTITNTPLTTVPDVVCRLSNVQSLNLNDNQLSSLPSNCFTHMRNLTTFWANYNRLTSLQEGVFTNLRRLTSLVLKDNDISSIEPRVFDESANLTSLSEISLVNNQMTELEPWPLIRAQHRWTFVYLISNRITNFTNARRWSFDCSSTQWLYMELNNNRITHISDVFNGWNIDDAGWKCILRKIFNFSIHFDDNPENCDCKDYNVNKFWRTLSGSVGLEEVYCAAPPELLYKHFDRIPLDRFVCNVTELCPPGCSCVKRPYNHSFEVSCPPATLNSLPNHLPNPNNPPPRYERFDLRFGSSNIASLESRDYFVDTVRMDVSNSQIETVTDDAWRSLRTVDQVDLSENHLITLPRLLQTENVTFRWIALHNNPLSCECDQRWLATWLKSLGSALQQPDSVICHSPDWLKYRSIVSLQNDDYCRNPNLERLVFILKVVLPTSGAILLVIVCLVILYRCRVKVFAKFNVHPFDVDECKNENMSFDAFVSCAGTDDALARAIVDRLRGRNAEEEDRGGYRVCYHEDDFPPPRCGDPSQHRAGNRTQQTYHLPVDH